MREPVTGTHPDDLPATAPRTGLGSAAATLASLRSSATTGLAATEAQARLARDGANEVPEEKSHPLLRFARKFWGLSAWMIELIALVSFILHKQADFWIALALLFVNASLSFLLEQRASAAVALLRARLHITARVLRDGTWQPAPARNLVSGDIVRVRSGDFVPADLQLIEGALQVDQSTLTGESQQIDREPDTRVYSGSVVRQGEATGVVIATGLRTYFGRTAQLIETAHPRLHIEEVVGRVTRWLLLIVGILVSVTFVASLVEGLPLFDTLPLSLVLLMSAVPVALPVMFTVSMAVGSVELARHGVLVTHLSAAEDAANMDVVCADKTGTLTMNRLGVTGALPQSGFTASDVIRDGALASNDADQDPIDLAFLSAAREHQLLTAPVRTVSFVPFSPKTRYTEAKLEDAGGKLRVVKGALRTVAELAAVDPAALSVLETRADAEAQGGSRVLAVARSSSDGPLRLVGIALLRDSLRPDSRQLVDELRSLGVAVKMLTGDALSVARQVARELGLGDMVRAPDLRSSDAQSAARRTALAQDSGGFAEVFPEDKLLVVKILQQAQHVVGMTGDGVNDAPALRQAEVGIAVRSATDVAKSAASVVLTTEGLGGIVGLVRNGRAIYRRVLTWIINKVSRTILKAGFVVIAFLATGRFVISALGMVVLVFMTDYVKIALSTDRVRPSAYPETWKIGPQIQLAVLLGLLLLIEALALLAFGWRRFGLATGAGLQTFTFQTLLFFALFSLVSIRERRAFWASRPSAIMLGALMADVAAGVSIGWWGLAELRPLPIAETAVIFLSAMVCCLGPNDLVKLWWHQKFTLESAGMPRARIP